MRITTEHSASSYGQPVILSDGGEVLDYADGVKAVRSKLGLTTAEFAAKMGTSRRTVEGWEQGRLPSNTALLLMATFFEPNSEKGDFYQFTASRSKNTKTHTTKPTDTINH